MTAIVVQLRRWDHRRLRLLRSTRDAGMRTRALIVLHAGTGKGTAQIADAVGYDPSAVLKMLHRYRAEGDEGLRDHREDNGHAKVDNALRTALATLVSGSPEDSVPIERFAGRPLTPTSLTLDQGREIIHAWLVAYNTERTP